jgi:hypothetical protein
MKNRRTISFRIRLSLAAALMSAALAPLHAQVAPPQGVSRSDWSAVRGAYEANRHQVVATDGGGYAARNSGQQWQTNFDGRGFLVQPDSAAWRWGLELRGYGFPGHERTVTGRPALRPDGSRLSYAWDDTLQEWFVNDQRGLEHGFTLERRPAASAESDAPLMVTLAVRGGLRPQVQADGRGVRFVDAQGAAALTYTDLQVHDAAGKTLPARFELVETPDGAPQLRMSVRDTGARYPLTIDPIAQQAYLKASNTDASDNFGYSVAISGDTMVVGALYEASNAKGVNGNQSDDSASEAGAAYVFVRSGGIWSQQAYLKASNTEAFDASGTSVAISGNTIVVGAPNESSNAKGVNGDESDNSASDAGAAYVFVRSGSTWSQQAYLKASNTEADDDFGSSVAISGDTVVVGSVAEDSNATGVNGDGSNNSADSAGAAYVFVRSGSTWSQQAYLKASNTEEQDIFGGSVAISGDTIVVGAPHEASNATGVSGNGSNNSAQNAGAAYVFLRSAATWSQQAYLKASNTEAFDVFGGEVSISGDTIVIAAQSESSNAKGVNGDQSNNSASDAGAAYVFFRNGSTWSQKAYLKASNTEGLDNFGTSVAISGSTVVVGAPGESSNATGVNGNQSNNSAQNAGAAYVFNGVPSFLTVTTISDAVAADGQTSLREAINFANSIPNAGIITFDPTVFAEADGPYTIELTTIGDSSDGDSAFLLSTDMQIQGPGANVLTVRRSVAPATSKFRLFLLSSGTTTTISGLTFANGNAGNFSGGAIFNDGGTLTLNNCALIDNTTTLFGGAIRNNGKLTINNSTFSGNTSDGFGGAIFNDNTLTLNSSTLTDNQAMEGGGALGDNNGDETFVISHCTIARNHTLTAGGGGGFDFSGTTSATLSHTILSGNTADGALLNYSTNTVGGEPSLVSNGYNLSDDAPKGLSAAKHDLVNKSNVNLDNLIYNGGPTAARSPLLRGRSAKPSLLSSRATCSTSRTKPSRSISGIRTTLPSAKPWALAPSSTTTRCRHLQPRQLLLGLLRQNLRLHLRPRRVLLHLRWATSLPVSG